MRALQCIITNNEPKDKITWFRRKRNELYEEPKPPESGCTGDLIEDLMKMNKTREGALEHASILTDSSAKLANESYKTYDNTPPNKYDTAWEMSIRMRSCGKKNNGIRPMLVKHFTKQEVIEYFKQCKYNEMVGGLLRTYYKGETNKTNTNALEDDMEMNLINVFMDENMKQAIMSAHLDYFPKYQFMKLLLRAVD